MQTTTTSQKIRIGLFTIVGILLLLVGIFFIGRSKSLFTSTYNVYSTFSNVGGLQVGNNVRFAGITAGTIENISVLNDTTVRVDMRMQSEYQKFIKTDAVAAIGSDGLMGDKLITINPGASSQTPLKDGSRLNAVNPMDFDKVIAKFTAVADNANTITAALADMATEMRGGKGTIGRLMYNDQLAVEIEGTMANARRMSASFADLGEQVRSGRGSIGQLLYSDSLSRALNRVMGSANQAAGTANDVMLTANKAVASVDGAVNQVNAAAYNFSENMKALQGNFFLKSYFKKKDLKVENQRENLLEAAEIFEQQADIDRLSNKELETIIVDADQTLERRRTAPPGSEILEEVPGIKRLTDEQLEGIKRTAEQNLANRRSINNTKRGQTR